MRPSSGSEAKKRAWASPEYKKRMSAIHKAIWSNPAHREKMIEAALHKKPQTEETKAKRRGKRNGRWNGGKNKNFHGYTMIYSPNHPSAVGGNYVLQHRLVAEEKIGRYLTKSDVVHHIDGDKSNNDKDNLIVLSLSGHNKIHRQLEEVAMLLYKMGVVIFKDGKYTLSQTKEIK